MSEFTFDYDLFSDLYKDVHGVRPRYHRFYAETTTDAERQMMWDDMLVSLDHAMAEQEREHAENTAAYEARITDLMASGAKDRETAIRWFIDSMELSEMDMRYGSGYVMYTLNMPHFCDQAKEMDVIFEEMLNAAA